MTICLELCMSSKESICLFFTNNYFIKATIVNSSLNLYATTKYEGQITIEKSCALSRVFLLEILLFLQKPRTLVFHIVIYPSIKLMLRQHRYFTVIFFKIAIRMKSKFNIQWTRFFIWSCILIHPKTKKYVTYKI